MKSLKKTARLTGVFYLVIFFANMFSFFLVGSTLSVAGDATATANNILANTPLFRASIGSYLLVFLSEIAVAVLLYVLLKPVNKTLSLMAMAARLAEATVLGINLLNHAFPLLLLGGADSLTSFSPDQVNALVMLFLDAHHYGVLISEAFFAMALAILGVLLIKADYIPGIFGILMFIGSAGYVADSIGIFLFPAAESIIATAIIAPLVVAELSFTLWLLIKGVRDPRPDDRSPLPAAQTEGAAA